MRKTIRGSSTKRLVTLSAIAAIGVLLGKFMQIPVGDFMRFSFENTTILFVSITFGPIYGAVVGCVQDLVGCIAYGYAINPMITLGYVCIGLVAGSVYRAAKKLPFPIAISLSVILAHLLGSVVIKSYALSELVGMPYHVMILWKLLNYVIVGAAEIFVLYLLLKSKPLLSQINKITYFRPHGTFKSVSEAGAYAKSVSGVFTKPGLDRVCHLLTSLDSPESSVKVVHVTGTNGKGSFSAMLSSILKSSGLKVGSFNSPYLYEMRESIRINGEPISEPELIALFDRLKPIADAMEDKPTEFELLTAAAYLKMKEEAVDIAIIECGMGGGLDATNVISSPALSVITGIAKDHTSYLGGTVEQIAKHKSGIIKQGCPVIVGKCPDSAFAVIESVAASLSAPITRCDTPAKAEEMTHDGSLINAHGIEGVRLTLLGVHQLYNASLAIRAAQLLSESFPVINEESIKRGIESAKWQGRFEILASDPLFIFDGAHNLDGITCATQSIAKYIKDDVICLTGVLADKEYEAMADEIAKVSTHAVTITPCNPRALDAVTYAEVLKQRGVNATSTDTVAEGVKKAIELAKKERKAVVCLGSLYLYREIRETVENSNSTVFDN